MYLVDKLWTSIYDFEYRRHEHVELDRELKFDEVDLENKENETNNWKTMIDILRIMLSIFFHGLW